MEQDEQEIEQLLEEIPRATSVSPSPHTDDRREPFDVMSGQGLFGLRSAQFIGGSTPCGFDVHSRLDHPSYIISSSPIQDDGNLSPDRGSYHHHGSASPGYSSYSSLSGLSLSDGSPEHGISNADLKPEVETGYSLIERLWGRKTSSTSFHDGPYYHQQHLGSVFGDPEQEMYLQQQQEFEVASALQSRKAYQQALLLQQMQHEEMQARQRMQSFQTHQAAPAQMYVLQNQPLLVAPVNPVRTGRQVVVHPSLALGAAHHQQGLLDSSSVSRLYNASQRAGCRYFAQGYCSRGDLCPYLHHSVAGTGLLSGKPGVFPERILRRSSKQQAAFPRKKCDLDPMNDRQRESYRLEKFLSQQPKYTSLKEVEGRICSIAKDQNGCRFLQDKFDGGSAEEVEMITTEVIEHVVELMTDPFGNYLVQKFLEVCNDAQRLKILKTVVSGNNFVQISVDKFGTRAVQKLIETLKSPEEVSIIISSLKSGVVTLIKDSMGNHVLQRCLQRLSSEDSQFIFDAAGQHCVDIATHKHGCCVLQRCVDFAKGKQKERLVSEIAANALVLSQNEFGNYVVQYILEGGPRVAAEVVARLDGKLALLSMQKYSSNVVQKCFKPAPDDLRARMIQELVSSPLFPQVLVDPYANYVLQAALEHTKGSLHSNLVDEIRPHLAALRSSQYGKRILTQIKK